MPINTTGNRDIDSATAEIATALRNACPVMDSDQRFYDEAMALRDAIMKGTRELDRAASLLSAGFTEEDVRRYAPAGYQGNVHDDDEESLRFADEEDEEPPVEEYDPGPEVDDEGGMSEYRHYEPCDDYSFTEPVL